MKKAALLLVLSLGVTATAAVAASPQVVELYTAQGCSSCVGSSQVIADLAANDRVLALTFPVDYWDYLGWRDTFAQPKFTDRQRAYMAHFSQRDVYTPQIIVNGRAQGPALPAAKAKALVAGARGLRPTPGVTLAANRVVVSKAPSPGAADVWLVRYDPQNQSVLVKAGENRGQTVVERHVVRELVRLGGWSGTRKAFAVPASDIKGLRIAVLVQLRHGGRIVAAKWD